MLGINIDSFSVGFYNLVGFIGARQLQEIEYGRDENWKQNLES